MSKFYEEVQAMLENDFDMGEDEDAVKSEHFMESYLEFNEELFKSKSGLDYKCLDSYGGEDCGSTYYAVYEFTRGNESCTIRFDGHYQSHYGTDYEGMKEVSAKQKTVTVWE